MNPIFRFQSVLLVCLALALATFHAIVAINAGREKSTTADELAHITGGYTFNHWHDYRLHPENGLLPQRWQALPLNFRETAYPSLNSEAWRRSDVWLMGYGFFYGSGQDHGPKLLAARTMNALFGAGTVLLVFMWGLRLWGTLGAVTAALLAALCPTMLAHSGLATSDMAMTFFFLASLSAYWRHLGDGRKRWWLLSVVLFGLAWVAKYTSILLLPLCGVLLLWRTLRHEPFVLGGRVFASTPARFAGLTLSLATHGLAAVLIIWAFCGFRYAAFNPALPGGEFSLSWDFLLANGSAPGAVIRLCRDWHLLPEGWLYGLAFVLKHAEARGAFLDGDYSIYGWVSFFPKAFLYKTPPSLLATASLAAGFAALWIGRASSFSRAQVVYRVAPLVVLFCVYWAFSLGSNLNIGHRHILPTYPVLYIFCGALGWAVTRAWRERQIGGAMLAAGLAVLLGWHALVTSRIHPHYLAYFSPLASGPAEGYKRLVDSSLDWGQDLPALRDWLAQNQQPKEPLYLSYFGTSEPDYYGIQAVRMSMLPDFDRPHPWHWFEPGLYAISATMLQHVYMPDRGEWTLENEREYQQLRRNDANFRALKANPHAHPELLKEISTAQWSQAWTTFERLRFARLCHYLRARRPDAMPGYSILVYRLSQAEIDAAIEGDIRTLAAAIEKAGADTTSSGASR